MAKKNKDEKKGTKMHKNAFSTLIAKKNGMANKPGKVIFQTKCNRLCI